MSCDIGSYTVLIIIVSSSNTTTILYTPAGRRTISIYYTEILSAAAAPGNKARGVESLTLES